MKMLLIALLSIGSISAFAGILGAPDEDPVVANLRSRFEQGIEPKAEYLLKHSFKCKEMIARRGNFSKEDYSTELRFEKFDGFLIAVQTNTKMHKTLYTFNGQELIASTKKANVEAIYYHAYRIDLKGYLISEFTKTNASVSSELAPISFSKGKVQSYSLCVPKLE
jgi:hypothetical protein